MSNIRILYNNVADLATITSFTSVGSPMDETNLSSEIKTEVWRSTTLTPYIIHDWDVNVQSINCVILPCTNLTSSSTIRVRLYDVADVLLYDSTVIPAVLSSDIYSGTQTYNVNLFPYGFLSKTAVWLPSTITNVSNMRIDLSDTSNTAGYIDCSRILAGVYWEPTYHIENGIQLNIVDESSTSRTNAGNLISDRGFIFDKISFNYALLTEADKSTLANIIRSVGVHKNFFISVFSGSSSGTEEHDYMIYGKRTNSALTYKIFGFYNHSMEMISW